MFPVKVKTFEGPLDLLLELLVREELDVTEVSLAAVTEQYLSHLRSVAEKRPDDLADFLVVAAKLLLLKSRVLLPTLNWQEEEGDDLERQLKMYREYFEASKRVEQMLGACRFMFFRERSSAPAERGFYPPVGIDSAQLKNVFQEILLRLKPIVSLPEARLKETVSIEEKIESLRKMIINRVKVNFKNILEHAKDKTEIIVSFLALLELVKQKVVAVRQGDNFGDIEVESVSL